MSISLFGSLTSETPALDDKKKAKAKAKARQVQPIILIPNPESKEVKPTSSSTRVLLPLGLHHRLMHRLRRVDHALDIFHTVAFQ